MNVIPFHRSHRTALVVDVRRGIDSEYEERVKRLFQSVNGSNIKCDIFTLSGPEATLTQGTTLPSASTVSVKAEIVTLTPGSPFSQEAAAAPSTDVESVVLAELDDALANGGYVQILHVRNLNAKK
jgi:hypothetical protein